MISSFLNWDKRPGLYGLKYAEILGCNANSDPWDAAEIKNNSVEQSEAILACMREKPVLDFARQMTVFFHYPWTGPNVWKPYYDGYYLSKWYPVFPDDPYLLLERGMYQRVPTIIGGNRNEGILNIIGYLKGISKMEVVEQNWDSLGPLILFHRYLQHFV